MFLLTAQMTTFFLLETGQANIILFCKFNSCILINITYAKKHNIFEGKVLISVSCLAIFRRLE